MWGLEFIGQVGGIAGVLAVIMFLIYRQDRKASEDRLREDRKFMEDRLTIVLNNYSDDCRRQMEVHSQFREALSELLIWLKRENGH